MIRKPISIQNQSSIFISGDFCFYLWEVLKPPPIVQWHNPTFLKKLVFEIIPGSNYCCIAKRQKLLPDPVNIFLQHHKEIHTREKPLSCRHCDKAFSSQTNLIKYMRIHMGEKPYLYIHCKFVTKLSIRKGVL